MKLYVVFQCYIHGKSDITGIYDSEEEARNRSNGISSPFIQEIELNKEEPFTWEIHFEKNNIYVFKNFLVTDDKCFEGAHSYVYNICAETKEEAIRIAKEKIKKEGL